MPSRVEEWEARMRAAPPPFRFKDGVQTGGGDRRLFGANWLTDWAD